MPFRFCRSVVEKKGVGKGRRWKRGEKSFDLASPIDEGTIFVTLCEAARKRSTPRPVLHFQASRKEFEMLHHGVQ